MSRPKDSRVKVLITGSNGFIAKNLSVKLSEKSDIEIFTFTKEETLESLEAKVKAVDFIFHLAGVNRPKSESEFETGNSDLTLFICNCVRSAKRKIPILYTSSIQAELNNPYGVSKHRAEAHLIKLKDENDNPIYIYRLPNVFGKWCKPNYNSAVATFCYNIVNDLPVHVNDPSVVLSLVYVDDVINEFINVLFGNPVKSVEPVYKISVGDLVSQLRVFKNSRSSLLVERVGVGLIRALYSTYISYFSPEQFSYSLSRHSDSRGDFVEVLKTKDSGQFSFFTAHPGITRGGHYHHSKNEKFLIIKGNARFGFRNIITNEKYFLETSDQKPEIVETIPGWTHDITNIGNDEMIVMLWANEIFEKERPDTIASKV